LRRRGNKFEDFEPEKKKKKNNHSLFPGHQQESARNRIKPKVFEHSNQISEKIQVKLKKTYLFILMNNNEIQIDLNP